MPDTTKTDDVILIDIPYIPPQIPLEKLHEHNDGQLRLLTKSEAEFWENAMKMLPPGRYTKDKLARVADSLGSSVKPRYGMIKDEKGLIVIYEGQRAEERDKTKKIVGKGGFGVVKFSQYITTAEISVLKIANITTLKRAELQLALWEGEIESLLEESQKEKQKNLKEIDRLQKKIDLLQKKVDQLRLLSEEIKHLEKAGLLNFSYGHVSKGRNIGNKTIYIHETLIGMKLVGRNNLHDELSEYADKKKNPDYNASLSPIQYLQIMNNIAKATEEIHKLHIIHRDIKSENYRVDPATGEVKLVDFGFAAYVPDGRLEATSDRFMGTPLFSPPELLKKSTFFKKAETKTYNNGTDTYSMLMVIAESLDLVKEKPIEYKGKKVASLRLITEKDPEFTEKFTNNKRLPADPDTRREILTFLQIATAPVSKENPQRVTSEEVVRFFDNVYLRASQQEEEVKKFRVATVSVEDVLTNPEIIKQIKDEGFNAIALTDNEQGRTTMEYAQAQRKLSDAGIKNIAPKVFFGFNNDSVNNRVKEFYQEKFNVRPPIYNYSHVEKKFEIPKAAPVWEKTKPSVARIEFGLFKQQEAAQKQTTAAKKPEAPQTVAWAPATPKRH